MLAGAIGGGMLSTIGASYFENQKRREQTIKSMQRSLNYISTLNNLTEQDINLIIDGFELIDSSST